MGAFFASLFKFFISFFEAGEKLGESLNNLADWAKQSSAVFVEEAASDREIKRLQNQAKREALMAELKVKKPAALPAPAADEVVQ